MVTLVAPLPEQAHHRHRFLQHVLADIGLRPALTGDVLVEILATADTEEKSSRHHRRRGRRSLGNDRGVGAYGGTRHPGTELQLLRGRRDAANDRPDKGAMSLPI